MINALQTALSGLIAASRKADTVAGNVANLTTAGSLEDADKAPYSTLQTTQTSLVDSEGNGQGVKTEVVQKNPGFVPAYSPDSPFADDEGFIGVPNTNLAEEAVNLSLADAAFKANVSVLKTVSEMQDELIESFDRKV